jgi:hypothetical protein
MSTSFLTLPQRLGLPTEQWRQLLTQLVRDLRVAIPGIVKSFDATAQTVTVQPAIREMINQNLVATPVDLPLLINVPIMLPRAGGYTLTMPVQEGDECLVIFADMCYDAWWQSGGQENNQVDRRRHDLSDGFALLGPWSQPRVLTGYATNKVQLRSDDGVTSIELGAGEITLKATTINLQGTVEITQDLHVDGDLLVDGTSTLTGTATIEGRSFLIHSHTGVTTGGGTSGPVL